MKKKSKNSKSETRWINDYEKSNVELEGVVKFEGGNSEETGHIGSITLSPGPKTFTLDEVIKIIDSVETKQLEVYDSWDGLDNPENDLYIHKNKLIEKLKRL